jgi:hypothetical protein
MSSLEFLPYLPQDSGDTVCTGSGMVDATSVLFARTSALKSMKMDIHTLLSLDYSQFWKMVCILYLSMFVCVCASIFSRLSVPLYSPSSHPLLTLSFVSSLLVLALLVAPFLLTDTLQSEPSPIHRHIPLTFQTSASIHICIEY